MEARHHLIREATPDDIPALVELGKRFQERGKPHCGLDEETLSATLLHLITDPMGILFVTDDARSAIGGLAHPHPFNRHHITGQELFWWAESEGRQLFDAMEERARKLGCHSWSMIALDSVRPEAVGALYRRRGYLPVEHSYAKVF